MPPFPQRPLAVTHHCARTSLSGDPRFLTTEAPHHSPEPPAGYSYSLATHETLPTFCATTSGFGWTL
jgi:hypothetical protein